MTGPCQFGFMGKHEPVIIGTPRSAMTRTECRACGLREPRGPGLFYKPTSVGKEGGRG